MGLTRGGRNIAWIEKWLRVPEGRDVGKPVRLRQWQKDEIRKIYDNPNGTRRAILSFGRKNGKTALAAFLLLLHLCGPEARPNSQLYSAAQSREQAAVLFALAAKMVRMNPALDHNRGGAVGIRDSGKQLYCPELGTLYRALSADASTAYGLSPVFIVHDELGQVKGPKSELYEALETATGAQDDPLSIVISTQAPTDADLLSILIDDAAKGADKRTVVSLYTADEGLDPFSLDAMKAANPAFGDFQNADETKAMAEDARRMPSREPEYRNLILNQRVDMTAPFVSRTVWQKCGVEVIDTFKDLPVYGGLDLSEVSDLTALVLIAPVPLSEAEIKAEKEAKAEFLATEEGKKVAAFSSLFGIKPSHLKWHVKPTFWLPGKSLAEKSRADRVPYDVWEKEGHLVKTAGPTVDYEYVAEHLRGLFDVLDIRKIAFDRWNWRHLKPWLSKVGFDESQLEGDTAVFEQFGQGFQSMSPALRDLESAILNQKIAHGNHPVLSMCAANATVQTDPAGNRKLSKMKSHGRIDGMVALAMAMSVAGTYKEERKPEYQMLFVG